MTPHVSKASGADAHILIIEDQASIRRLLTSLLRTVPYQVTSATSIEEAVELLGAHHFDLILTDTFSARSDDALASIAPVIRVAGRTPILVLTAHRLDVDQVQAAGCAGLLRKPFDIDDLLGQVRAFLAQPDGR